MIFTPRNSTCLIFSACLHGAILLLLLFGFAFSTPIPVFQNSNKHDVISAVVLGDIQESKVLPQPTIIEQPVKAPQKELAPVKPKDVAKKTDVIALKKEQNKRDVLLKDKKEKQKRDLLAKDLLADIQKASEKQKVLRQKNLRANFEKTLREESEKSLREHSVPEDIKLKAKISRQAQGEINKYKALIIQAISENWLVPPHADKKLYCQLMIRISEKGKVLDVQVMKSSGDKSLDRSARAAVLKASPLPVPKNEAAFQEFKEFVLKVRPENIMHNENV